MQITTKPSTRLDRRKNAMTLRPLSSTLSSSNNESGLLRRQSSNVSMEESGEVPMIDMYQQQSPPPTSPLSNNNYEKSETKRMRLHHHSSVLSTIWRTFSSLVPVSRDNHNRAIALADTYDDGDELLETLSPSSSSPCLEISLVDSSSSVSSVVVEEGEKQQQQSRHGAWVLKRKPALKEVNVEAYMANREMTELQEKWNAVTVIPAPLFCLYYIFTRMWVPTLLVQEMQQEINSSGVALWPETWIGEPEECQSWNRWGLPFMPPLPVLAILVGISLHAPWSILYHWKYAHRLPARTRVRHWSRRMDHAMMHLASALIAYATSGSVQFLMATGMYNADSAYRHFLPKVAPRRNKFRMTVAFILYTLPILRQGHVYLLAHFYAAFGVSAWLFATYPIGGWSHAAFHVVMVFVLFPLLQAASLTGASQESVQMAAQCMAWNPTTLDK